MSIKPINGRVLVELIDQYGSISTPDQKYGTQNSGVIIDFASDITNKEIKVGKTGFWEDFKDSNSVKREGKKLALIKFEDIGGLE